jgi:hypothetical protein
VKIGDVLSEFPFALVGFGTGDARRGFGELGRSDLRQMSTGLDGMDGTHLFELFILAKDLAEDTLGPLFVDLGRGRMPVIQEVELEPGLARRTNIDERTHLDADRVSVSTRHMIPLRLNNILQPSIQHTTRMIQAQPTWNGFRLQSEPSRTIPKMLAR